MDLGREAALRSAFAVCAELRASERWEKGAGRAPSDVSPDESRRLFLHRRRRRGRGGAFMDPQPLRGPAFCFFITGVALLSIRTIKSAAVYKVGFAFEGLADEKCRDASN